MISPLHVPHNMVNFVPLAAEMDWRVWGTQQISTGFASYLHYCSNVAQQTSSGCQTMQDVWPSPGLVHYTYISGGCCPWQNFARCKVHVQSSLCIQVLRSPILEALLHGTPAAGVSQTLRHGTKNGITELSQMAPPVFGWAAITLGISPHSSVDLGLHLVCLTFCHFAAVLVALLCYD